MRLIHKTGRALSGCITTHPLIVLTVFLVAAAVLGWEARNFKIDASADTLLMRGNRHYIQTQQVNQRFAPREFLLIAYQPTDHALFSTQTFADLRSINDLLRRMDRVESVRSIRNVPLFLTADADSLTQFDPSEWTIENRDYDFDTLRDTFNGHPVYENLIINEDQTATAIQVLFKSNDQLDQLNRNIVDLQAKRLHEGLAPEESARLEKLKKQAEPLRRRLDRTRREEVRRIREMLSVYDRRANIYMGGVHVLAFQLIRIIRNDLIVFGGAIAVMICLILLMIFRRPRWVIIPMVCCAVSVASTMGLFALFDLKTTVISSSFVALQLILTLAIVIHLIVQYRESNAERGDCNQRELVRETLRRKAAPCFYAGITTSVGFASLLSSGIQPVISFGWMMIIAMFFSIGVALALFPAMMTLFPCENAKNHRSLARIAVNGCAGASLKYGWAVGILAAAALIGGVIGALKLDVENSFINYFRVATRVHRELTFIDRELGGSTPLDVVYTFPESAWTNRLVLTAENVQTLQRIQHVLKNRQAVGKLLSVVNLTALARRVNDNRPLTEYELTAMYRLMDDAVREDLIGSFLSTEHRQARFNMRIQDTTPGLDRGHLLKSIRDGLEKLGLSKEQYSLTNLFILYEDILRRLFTSQVRTLGIVYGVLLLTFWIIFRSFKIALIGMVPNLLSTAIVLGSMGWLGVPLDLMTITIAAIAMGIAVDDTIHYIHRFMEERAHHDGREAVRRSHGSVGFAILYTSVIIVLGFSLLGFSDFVPSVYFGLFTGLAMASALISDLCVLPALLKLVK